MEVGVERYLCRARPFLGALRAGPHRGDGLAQMRRVAACVGDDVRHARKAFDQARRLRAISLLAGRDRRPDRQPTQHPSRCEPCRSVRCASARSRSPQLPPFPAALEWASQIVLPTRTYSEPGSTRSASSRRFRTPEMADRRKRECSICQFPVSGGMSRQEHAPRAIHNTASTQGRMSAPDLPRSPTSPGRRGAMRSHCRSVGSRLLMTATSSDRETEREHKSILQMKTPPGRPCPPSACSPWRPPGAGGRVTVPDRCQPSCAT